MEASNFFSPASPTSEAIVPQPRMPVYRLTTHYDFILYQSNEGCSVLNDNQDKVGTMAVYQMYNNKHIDNVRLLGCMESDGNFGSMNHAIFHPDLPLLALRFLSRLGDSHIVLWLFRNSIAFEAQFILLHHELIRSRDMNSGCSLVSIATLKSKLKSLQFSACGRSLIYQLRNETYPHIIDIGELPVYKVARDQTENEGSSDQSSRPSPQPGSASISSAMKKVNALSQEMKLHEPVHHTDGSVTELSFDSGGPNRNIKLVHSANGREHEQSLLSLPAWRDVKNISASVRMPTGAGEDKITIILNKTVKPFYVLGGSNEHAPPAVVRKDIRAIATPKMIRSLPGSVSKAEASTSWGGVGFQDGQSDGEDEQANKRFRFDGV
jgi:hypothetical protein